MVHDHDGLYGYTVDEKKAITYIIGDNDNNNLYNMGYRMFIMANNPYHRIPLKNMMVHHDGYQ